MSLTIQLDGLVCLSSQNTKTGELTEYEEIKRRHPSWGTHTGEDLPVYSLPEAVIDRFSTEDTMPRLKRRQPLPAGNAGRWNAEQSAAEREFTRFCDQANAVGYHHGVLVGGGVLRRIPPQLEPEIDIPLWQWRKACDFLESAAGRLKGAAGFLLTHPSYLEDAKLLRTAWRALPPEERHRFPLRPVRAMSRPGHYLGSNGTVASGQEAVFLNRVAAFLSKWGLTSLLAWDLPDPAGPLMANDLPPGAPAQPFGSVTTSIPCHFRFQSDELPGMVADLQKSRLRQSAIDMDYALLQHHEQYGRMLDILLLERAVRSRYPDGILPRGMTSVLMKAMADATGLGQERVRTVRNYIRTSLDGRKPNFRRPRTPD